MERNVYGEIKLPLARLVGSKIANIGLAIGVPGASWLYFKCLLGPGVRFEVSDISDDRIEGG